jgi:pyruvate ferredoxin oxidoreductase gamma subunit
MATVDVTGGLPADGKLIVNSQLAPSRIREQLKLKDRKVYSVDASKISRETIGREIPNTPMLGALIKISGILKFEDVIKDLEIKLKKKFASKPEIVAGNLAAVRRAWEEVKSE